MRENSLKTAILAGALVVFFAVPSIASAGQVIPPGNSAATQYTQAFPTAGGNVEVRDSIGEPGGGNKTPSKVIGKKTTEELESQGPEGTAVAKLAAESAPPTPESESSESSSGGAAGGGGNKPSGGSHAGGGGATQQGGAEAGGGGQGSGSPASNPASGGQTVNTAAAEAAGSGSSGFSEVLGQATGSTSGQMGAFLPLVLLAALVLALVYAWRRRQQEPRVTS
jgi:cobalamin biosynthesis Mg chelatase CobN